MIHYQKTFWKQKAKVKHVNLVDTNLSYFHKVANGKRNRKYLKEIKTQNGTTISGEENIMKEKREDFILRYNREQIDETTLLNYLPLILTEVSLTDNEELTRTIAMMKLRWQSSTSGKTNP